MGVIIIRISFVDLDIIFDRVNVLYATFFPELDLPYLTGVSYIQPTFQPVHAVIV